MQYQIDPCTAPAVLEMFTMYDKGATMKEIVAYMSERGVTTVRGKKIDLNFMARLLKNRKYIGEYSYRHIVTPNGIPAIVPQDLFDRVQQRLAVNRKAPARHKAEDDYLLTTKLFCGTCGAMMVGESGTSSSKGRKYHYYRCVNTKKHRACDAKHKTVRKLPLENAVVNAVMAKIMDDNFVEYVADAVMDIQSRESSVLPPSASSWKKPRAASPICSTLFRWGLSMPPPSSGLMNWKNAKGYRASNHPRGNEAPGCEP